MTSWKALWALLLLLPLLGILVWNYLNRKKKIPSLQFSSLKIIKKIPPSLRTRFMIVPPLLKALALALAIVALARPQEANTKVKKISKGLISSSAWISLTVC